MTRRRAPGTPPAAPTGIADSPDIHASSDDSFSTGRAGSTSPFPSAARASRSTTAQSQAARTASLATTAAALALATMVSLSGCASPAPAPTPTPTKTVEAIAPSGDGILRIGTLFPTSGEVAFIGPAQVAGVETAIREINEAGGVNDVPVEVFHRDSADATTEKAEASFADLAAKGADVVIGPSSSVLAQRLIPAAVTAKVAMISPAATYPQLTDADDSGLFFRTIPSYGLQGAALAQVLTDAGVTDVAVIYSDDALGQALEAALAAGLDARDGTLVESVALPASGGDVAAAVATVSKATPDAVIIATPASSIEQTKALITRLSSAKLGGSKLWLTSQNLADYSQALPAGTMTGVNGILEGAAPDDAFVARLKQADPAVKDTRYAAEAYDATILAALAAILAGDDAGLSVAGSLQAASSGGIKCTSFGECLDVLKTESDIDYDGITGPLTLDDAGDVTSASFGIFAYGAENKFTRTGTVLSD